MQLSNWIFGSHGCALMMHNSVLDKTLLFEEIESDGTVWT